MSAMISAFSECGGSEQAESPECTPASSICSITPQMNTSPAVAEGIDIHLDGVAQIGVDQHRALARHHHGLGDVAGELRLVVHDLHGAAAEHVRRADHHREADRRRDRPWPRRRSGRCRFRGCLSPSRSISALKRSRSSARSIASGEVPRIGTLAFSSACASLSGVWPPNCTITPLTLPFAHSVRTISSTSSSVSGSK